MKKRLFLLVAFSALSLHAQETLTRGNGKKIILNENGTWSYKSSLKSEENDCAKYVKSSVNRLTGNTNIAANDILSITKDNGKTGFSILMMNSKDNDTTIISITTLEKSCVTEKSLLGIVYSDGTIAKMNTNSSENCEGKSSLYLGGVFGLENLQKLIEKKINTIMISSTKGNISHDLSDSEAEMFRNTLICLSNALTK